MCKLDKNTIKRKVRPNIFNLGTTYSVSSYQKPQQGCIKMTLNLVALQLKVSHFGRKYLQNNGLNEMVGLRTREQVSQCIWFGNDGVLILDCDRPGKTQYSQLGVESIIDFPSE